MKSKQLLFLLVGFGFSFLFQSCLQFKMSEKDLNNYYSKHQPRPQFFEYDTLGHTVFYAHTGDSNLPLLLFIHGAPGRWFGYINYLSDSDLLQHFQMIAIDRPGYGNSGKKGAVTSISEQATLLQPIIDKYAHVPIIIVGRSYGGPIASCVAAFNKVKVNALLLVANAADPNLEKFWWFSKPVNSKFGRWLFEHPINVSSDEKFAHKKELKSIVPIWKDIVQPTTILQGGKDFIIYPENGKFTDSVLVNAPHRYIYLPQNGHLITNENPALVKECVVDLLNQVCHE